MEIHLLSQIAFASVCALALSVNAHAETGQRLDVNESPCFPIFEIELDAGKDPLPHKLSDSLNITSEGEQDTPQFRCIGADGIKLLIDRVQNELFARGYVTSRVLAEPQNLQSGKLKLKVLLGRIQSIEWEPQANDLPKRATTLNTLPAKEGEILNLKDIEQGLENFKRVPTAEADIQIIPGEQPGYSHLRITHQQDRLFRFSVNWDDSGTPSTGKQQASATFSYDNWLTLSDLFYITVNQDTGKDKEPGSRGTHGKSIHYSIPMGYQLLSFNLSNNSYHQTVAGSNADYIYAGTSDNADIKLSRVIQRNAFSKTTVGIKAFRRQSNNYIDDSEVVVQKRVVGGWIWDIGNRQTVGQTTVEGNLAFKQGTKDFGSIPAPEEMSQTGTSRMRIWNADASVNLPFKLSGMGASSEDVQRIQTQVKALDKKISTITEQVTPITTKVDGITNQISAQNKYIQEAAQYLKSQAQGSLADGEQWLKDFYEQRTQMYPSEAARYKKELDSLLKQYREEQKAKQKKR